MCVRAFLLTGHSNLDWFYMSRPLLHGMPPDARARAHTQTVSPLIGKVREEAHGLIGKMREEAHGLIWGLLSDLLRPVLCILIVAQVISTLITLLLLEFGGKVLVCWRTRPADAKRGTVEPGMPAAAGQVCGQGRGRGADLSKDAVCCNASSMDELIVTQPATICLGPDTRACMYGAEANPPGRSVRDAALAASICPCPSKPAPACLDQGAPEGSEKGMPAAPPAGLGTSTTVSRLALKVALPALSITCPASSPRMWDSTPPVTPSSTVASTLPTRANVQRSFLSPHAFNGLKAQEVASDTCQGAGVTSASGAGACETAKSPGKRLSWGPQSWGPEGSRGVVQILRNMSSASASKFTSSRHRRTKSSPVQYLALPDSEGLSDVLVRHPSTVADVPPTCETGDDSGGLGPISQSVFRLVVCSHTLVRRCSAAQMSTYA